MSILVKEVNVYFKSFEPVRPEIGFIGGVIRYAENTAEKQFMAIGKYDATNDTLIDAEKWKELSKETEGIDTTNDDEHLINHAITRYVPEAERITFVDTTENNADYYLNCKNIKTWRKWTIKQ